MAAGRLLVTPSADQVGLTIAQGYRFLALGMDSQFLGAGARRALAMLP